MRSFAGETGNGSVRGARTGALYLRLAVGNMRKNKQTFVPYILTCVGTVAMYFMMHAIAANPGISEIHGAVYLRVILNLGVIVIGMFAMIFLFYTNSFLIKRRKKEFGLYTILGMERRHVARVLLWETLMMSAAGFMGGLLTGLLFSRLMFLLLHKMLNFSVPLAYAIQPESIAITAMLFGAIFFAILLNNLRQIHLAQPVELLRDSAAGEREPKTRWLLALAGFLCLGSGYWIALTTESPLDALMLFFVAVVLVILGTYMLFTAGSVALLKALRRNRKFYYKSAHFTGISGMMYRMKQNAAGLASICILSTAVLVMISGTVSMYIGFEDIMRGMFPRDIVISVRGGTDADIADTQRLIGDRIRANGLTGSETMEFRYIEFFTMREGTEFLTDIPMVYGDKNASAVIIIPVEDYNRHTGNSVTLAPDEVMIHSDRGAYGGNTVTIWGETFRVKEESSGYPFYGTDGATLTITRKIYMTVSDPSILHALSGREADHLGDRASKVTGFYAVDVDGERADEIALYEDLQKFFKQEDYPYRVSVQSKAWLSGEFFGLYGGLFFLGIFLGALFIMATVLIIYYKQISEGYDDQQRFAILQKVGMSKAEIRKTIRSQVLTVFFLPLAAAVIHLAFASKMLLKLLSIISVTDSALFFICAGGTIAVFAALYTLVYSMTARTYYRIVDQT